MLPDGFIVAALHFRQEPDPVVMGADPGNGGPHILLLVAPEDDVMELRIQLVEFRRLPLMA
ncbi:hypothetical protein D3C75_1369480 [compost metagenome]